MQIVLNATPVIYVVKSGLYELLPSLEVDLVTSEQVAKEVLIPDFPEYSILKNFFDTIEIKKTKILDEFLTVDKLDIGEASILSLAKALQIPAVLDDRVGRYCALENEIETYHTTFFIFRALHMKTISKTQAVAYLDRMIDAGWYCDIKSYVKIRNNIETL